jgi:hypothetical protein
MSRFTSVSFLAAALTLSGLAAPVAFAQPAPVAPSHVRAPHKPADMCFTQDLVPSDDSSMLTVCGVNGPSKIIFGQ